MTTRDSYNYSVYAVVSCVLTDFPLVSTEVEYLLRCLLAIQAFKDKILIKVISTPPPRAYF